MNKNIKIFAILTIFSLVGLFRLNSMSLSPANEFKDFQSKWMIFLNNKDDADARSLALDEIDNFLANVSPLGKLAIMPLFAGQDDNLNNHPAFTINFADAQAVFIKHGFLENVTGQDILGTQASNNPAQNNVINNPIQNSNPVLPPNPLQPVKKSEKLEKFIKGGVIIGLSITAIGLVVYLYKKYQDKKARDMKNEESEEIESDIILMER